MVRVREVVSLVLVLVCHTNSRATLTNNGYNNVLVAISPEVRNTKKSPLFPSDKDKEVTSHKCFSGAGGPEPARKDQDSVD